MARPHQPPPPIQPQRAEGRQVPTEPPEPVSEAGQTEAGHPHPTDLPPQPQPGSPAAEARDRRKGLLAGFRRMLGLGRRGPPGQARG